MQTSSRQDIRRLKELLRRDHTLNGAVLLGLDGYPIELQARAVTVLSSPHDWRSSVRITGMARGAVSEALDRVAGAFAKLGIPDPQVDILINLAPPDLLKEGTSLDLPIALIALQAAGVLPQLPEATEEQLLIIGELGLHGGVRRVPGVLSMAHIAKPGTTLIVPAGNEKEAALILAAPGHEKCKVYVVTTLEEAVGFFSGRVKLENALKGGVTFESVIPKCVDFGRIRGQQRAKDAAVIAAAGGHNLLFIGPPGEGKSLLASAIPGILPHLAASEKVELTRIYSACGELDRDGVAVTRRPMRSVHHSASKQAIVGGGSKIPKPGEITLAHLGVLFLDEFAEFSQSTLDSLRQPIEDGTVDIARVGATIRYPCRFTLVAAMNPCPCGYFGTDMCKCQESEVHRYHKKISGPILDRIDLQVELARLSNDERFAEGSGADETPAIRANVEKARARQEKRFAGTDTPFNAAIPGGYIKDFCEFSPTGFEHYRQTVDQNRLSTRSMDRMAKVARTVADLADSDQTHPEHVDTAASFIIGGILRDSF